MLKHGRPSALFWRAVAAFLALPAIVAYAIPWLLRPAGVAPGPAGIAVIASGSVLLLWCVRDFYAAGRGTLAPWAPPKNLVTVGLYRVSRNPMYVSVLLVLAGWALSFHSRTLWTYAACVALGFHLRVILFEEPWLARTHGDQWIAYRGRVRRWFGGRQRIGTAGLRSGRDVSSQTPAPCSRSSGRPVQRER